VADEDGVVGLRAETGASKMLTVSAGAVTGLAWASVPTSGAYHATSGTETSSTATSFVDLDAMTVAVADAGTYLVTFEASVSNTMPSRQNEYVLTINGAEATGTRRFVTTKKDAYSSVSFIHMAEAVPAGAELRVRYKTSSGTHQVHDRALTAIRLS
jgi:hypothetical protein